MTMDLVYSSCRRHSSCSNHGILNNRMRPHSSLSCHLEPFKWDPPNPERSGGAWVPPPPYPCGHDTIFQLNEHLVAGNQSQGHSPAYTRSLMLNSRDKESLLEEIIRLKRNLVQNSYYLKRDKVHAATVKHENRKLLNDVRDIEMQNTPLFKGHKSSQTRAKLQGLKFHYEDLQGSCDLQHHEITHLRRDVRVSFTREVEVERDVILDEIIKLQKEVKRLKAMHCQVSCENKELIRVRDRAADLEAVNYQLQDCMDIFSRALDRATREFHNSRQKMIEWSLCAKRNKQLHADLTDEIDLLKELIQREQLQKQRLDQQQDSLEKELANFEQKPQAQVEPVVVVVPSPNTVTLH